MIDLTPLDVRKKRGDFRRGLRGYDPGEVDTFIALVAERMEDLVRENLVLSERVARLDRVRVLEDREQAVNEALVTAQKLRQDIKGEAVREADVLRRDAESEAKTLKREAEEQLERVRQGVETETARLLRHAERQREEMANSLLELARRRARFMNTFRALLEQETDALSAEESKIVLEDLPLDLKSVLAMPEAVTGESAAALEELEDAVGAAVEEPTAEEPSLQATDTAAAPEEEASEEPDSGSRLPPSAETAESSPSAVETRLEKLSARLAQAAAAETATEPVPIADLAPESAGETAADVKDSESNGKAGAQADSPESPASTSQEPVLLGPVDPLSELEAPAAEGQGGTTPSMIPEGEADDYAVWKANLLGHLGRAEGKED